MLHETDLATEPPTATRHESRTTAGRDFGVWTQIVLVMATVLAWMGLGLGLDLSTNAYLVAGVPIVIVFQCVIERRPLRALWRFDGGALRWGRVGIAASVVAGVLPMWALAQAMAPPTFGRDDPAGVLWAACAVVGSLGVGWSVANARTLFRTAPLWMMATLVAAVAALFAGAHYVRHGPPGDPWSGVRDFVLYVDVSFLIEEVAFRGAFDVAIAGTTDGPRRRSTLSAAGLGMLWGLWHTPVVRHGPGGVHVIPLMLVHGVLGVFLSKIARRSGNLAPGAVAHAAIDALRNFWLL